MMNEQRYWVRTPLEYSCKIKVANTYDGESTSSENSSDSSVFLALAVVVDLSPDMHPYLPAVRKSIKEEVEKRSNEYTKLRVLMVSVGEKEFVRANSKRLSWSCQVLVNQKSEDPYILGLERHSQR